MASPATFRLGSVSLPPDSAAVAKEICSEAGLTANELNIKWEAWAIAQKKSTDVPSAADLRELAEHLRSKAAKANKTPINVEKAASRLIYKAGPTPTRINVDDFFTYLNEDELPEENPPPARMEVEPAQQTDANESPAKDVADPNAEDEELVLAGADIGRPTDIALAGDGEADEAYVGRDGSGRVEVALNGGVDELPDESRQSVTVRHVEVGEAVTRYMNDDVPGKIHAVRTRLREIGQRILARVKDMRGDDAELPKLSPQSFTDRSPDVVLALGRIRVELDESEGVAAGRINPSSVVLESEDGYRVKLDLSRMHEQKQPLFLHPGMIALVEGVNTNGRIFQVHAVYDNAMALSSSVRRELKDIKPKEDEDEILPDVEKKTSDEPSASVLFAAGPFTTSTNLNYEPFDDLLAVISRTRPDAVVLVGPFVDVDHPKIAPTTPVVFESIFEARILSRIRKTLSSMAADSPTAPRPHFVLIPSLSDVHHDFVCPQPAFRLPDGQAPGIGISFLPNPSVIELAAQNGRFTASLGVSSLPALQDISSDCLCWNKGDRFSAIASHMLRQCSFYPTFPPSAAVPLDCSLLENLVLPDPVNTPTVDVLVSPSKLKAFVKTADGGAVAVNPGLLSRGSSGGTYAELRIPLHRADKQRSLNTNADKLKASIVRL